MPRAKSRPAKGKAAKPARKAKAPFPLPAGWRLDRGGKSISLRLETKDFLEAVALINRLAGIAEELEHHPDVHLERWNQLRITTYSHDAGKLTDRDERLAQGITELLLKQGHELSA
ncbi:MAG: 4a-hydroxytetrahydrobiopterin dehydratase [Halobacteriales archaeon]|nr:4a-hydroxytetrahydrobiopterin dehydratase [Halobacteriales archaeon]